VSSLYGSVKFTRQVYFIRVSGIHVRIITSPTHVDVCPCIINGCGWTYVPPSNVGQYASNRLIIMIYIYILSLANKEIGRRLRSCTTTSVKKVQDHPCGAKIIAARKKARAGSVRKRDDFSTVSSPRTSPSPCRTGSSAASVASLWEALSRAACAVDPND
jgi:hypothetical protein